MATDWKMDDMPGVVTLSTWTMTPEGGTAMYLWCANWVVVPDKAMPVEGFKSTEKWTLFGIVNGRVRIAIPGCQIKAWMYTMKCPPVVVGTTNVYAVE